MEEDETTTVYTAIYLSIIELEKQIKD